MGICSLCRLGGAGKVIGVIVVDGEKLGDEDEPSRARRRAIADSTSLILFFKRELDPHR